ncbi:coilin [Elgaria multicarinata webbii]|uniref:coilin n=1 Tax=Elgaria multicarinata webbii TaxID=159646 RepID=UPI002FCCFF6C
MAAAAGGCELPVRLRLLFDYPPPGTPACGLCWLLLEPSQVRLVTDLISLIRDKFGFSRRAKLSLFLDGALLPPTESARLVRDNDSLRVKLEEVVEEESYNKVTNGFSNLSKKQRKRHWQKLEAKDSESEDEVYRKRKKRKWNSEHLSSQDDNTTNIQDSTTFRKRKKTVTKKDCTADDKNDDSTFHSKKLKKQVDREKEQKAERDQKKKKTRALETKNTSQKANKTLTPRQKGTTKNTIARSSTKKGGTSSESSTSSSDSDDSIAGTKQKLTNTTKVASQHSNKSQLASPVQSLSASKLAAKCKDKNSPKIVKSKTAKSPSSSSDSDSSSGEEEEQQSRNLKNKLPCNNQGTVTGLTSKAKPKTSSSESDSSQSETCTIKKPKTNPIVSQALEGPGGKQLPAATGGSTTNFSDSHRGRGRGENLFWRGPRVRGCRGMIRGRGRGRGESANYFYTYNSEHPKQQQLNEAATNSSVIIQNPLEVPKKDYSILPLLAAPPQVGEKIAFKLLELTENYTPEVSDYKEGKIVSWNPASKQLELEILSFSSVAKEPGKFDLVYQSADGAETIEYAVSQDRKIIQSWNALIEPRLIVDPSNNESSTKNGNPSDVNLLVPCVNSL